MSRDDLISRGETIKCIKKWFYILGKNPDRLVDSIISLPRIDQEHSQGSWRNIDGMFSCSECRSQFYDMSPYCPICGANMKEWPNREDEWIRIRDVSDVDLEAAWKQVRNASVCVLPNNGEEK